MSQSIFPLLIVNKFIPSLWFLPSTELTREYADLHYLKFPIAQGSETIPSNLTVSGITSLGVTTIAGDFTLNNTKIHLGTGSGASQGADSIQIGSAAAGTGANSISIGKGATTNANANSVALGVDATATGANQVVLGTASENVRIRGTITTTGFANFEGALSTATLGSGGTLTANGGITVPTGQAVSINGTSTLAVAGTTTAGIINASGLITASAGLTVPTGQAVNINGTSTLTVGGLITASGGLSFTGTLSTAAITASGLITANGGLTVASGQVLTSTGTTTLTGTTTAGIINASGLITANGGLTVASGQVLTSTGTTTLTGTTTAGIINASGLISANNGLTVATTKALTLSGTATLTTTTGLTTLGGGLTMGGSNNITLSSAAIAPTTGQLGYLLSNVLPADSLTTHNTWIAPTSSKGQLTLPDKGTYLLSYSFSARGGAILMGGLTLSSTLATDYTAVQSNITNTEVFAFSGSSPVNANWTTCSNTYVYINTAVSTTIFLFWATSNTQSIKTYGSYFQAVRIA